ncbi:DNA alkylation repair protein [Effusibacillus consociatus]|uniref:DNA alkylation repair protein n=1 Tax=Effusibacillus consociatus TaxID=1117041 RepID=A0ABV9Q788_9BACL
MSAPYLCPNCRSNRTRFAILEQVPQYVKLDPNSGEIVEQYDREHLDPFHIPYQGTPRRIQCGVCGLVEDEQTFVALAQTQPKIPR